jgi:hypothetical protein
MATEQQGAAAKEGPKKKTATSPPSVDDAKPSFRRSSRHLIKTLSRDLLGSASDEPTTTMSEVVAKVAKTKVDSMPSEVAKCPPQSDAAAPAAPTQPVAPKVPPRTRKVANVVEPLMVKSPTGTTAVSPETPQPKEMLVRTLPPTPPTISTARPRFNSPRQLPPTPLRNAGPTGPRPTPPPLPPRQSSIASSEVITSAARRLPATPLPLPPPSPQNMTSAPPPLPVSPRPNSSAAIAVPTERQPTLSPGGSPGVVRRPSPIMPATNVRTPAVASSSRSNSPSGPRSLQQQNSPSSSNSSPFKPQPLPSIVSSSSMAAAPMSSSTNSKNSPGAESSSSSSPKQFQQVQFRVFVQLINKHCN